MVFERLRQQVYLFVGYVELQTAGKKELIRKPNSHKVEETASYFWNVR
jgi:hypothetical protein